MSHIPYDDLADRLLDEAEDEPLGDEDEDDDTDDADSDATGQDTNDSEAI